MIIDAFFILPFFCMVIIKPFKYMKNPLFLFIAAAALLISTANHAQTVFKVCCLNNAEMKLKGTSTLHDWEMQTSNFKGEAGFTLGELNNELKALSMLTFTVPVENLKSDKKKLDETAYKALKASEHREIEFALTSAVIKPIQKDKYMIVASGNLNIAGVTQVVTMMVSCLVNPDKSLTCTGSKKLKMSDFKVAPPSFLGFMKTGDEIAIEFTFQLKS